MQDIYSLEQLKSHSQHVQVTHLPISKCISIITLDIGIEHLRGAQLGIFEKILDFITCFILFPMKKR